MSPIWFKIVVWWYDALKQYTWKKRRCATALFPFSFRIELSRSNKHIDYFCLKSSKIVKRCMHQMFQACLVEALLWLLVLFVVTFLTCASLSLLGNITNFYLNSSYINVFSTKINPSSNLKGDTSSMSFAPSISY